MADSAYVPLLTALITNLSIRYVEKTGFNRWSICASQILA